MRLLVLLTVLLMVWAYDCPTRGTQRYILKSGSNCYCPGDSATSLTTLMDELGCTKSDGGECTVGTVTLVDTNISILFSADTDVSDAVIGLLRCTLLTNVTIDGTAGINMPFIPSLSAYVIFSNLNELH